MNKRIQAILLTVSVVASCQSFGDINSFKFSCLNAVGDKKVEFYSTRNLTISDEAIANLETERTQIFYMNMMAGGNKKPVLNPNLFQPVKFTCDTVGASSCQASVLDPNFSVVFRLFESIENAKQNNVVKVVVKDRASGETFSSTTCNREVLAANAPGTDKKSGINPSSLTEFKRGSLVSSALVAKLSKEEIKEAIESLGIPRQFVNASPYDVVNIFKIEYNSYDLKGAPVVASGVLILPNDPQKALSVLSFQKPTTPLNKPSLVASNGNAKLLAIPAMLALYGSAVVYADGIGYGSSKGAPEPYTQYNVQAADAHRMLEASLSKLEKMTIPLQERVFVAGYSLGAGTSLDLVRYMERFPIGSLSAFMVLPGSGVYDLNATFAHDFAKGYTSTPEFTAWAALTWGSVNGQTTEDIISNEYQSTIRSHIANFGEESTLPKKLSLLFNADFLKKQKTGADEQTQILRKRLSPIRSGLGGVKIRAFHGTEDKIAQPRQTEILDQQLKNFEKVNYELTWFPGKDHKTALPLYGMHLALELAKHRGLSTNGLVNFIGVDEAVPTRVTFMHSEDYGLLAKKMEEMVVDEYSKIIDADCTTDQGQNKADQGKGYFCGEIPTGEIINKDEKILTRIELKAGELKKSYDGGEAWLNKNLNLQLRLARQQNPYDSKIDLLDKVAESKVNVNKNIYENIVFSHIPKGDILDSHVCLFMPGMKVSSPSATLEVKGYKKIKKDVLWFTVTLGTVRFVVQGDTQLGSIETVENKICATAITELKDRSISQLRNLGSEMFKWEVALEDPSMKVESVKGFKLGNSKVVELEKDGLLLNFVDFIGGLFGFSIENLTKAAVTAQINELIGKKIAADVKDIESGEYMKPYMEKLTKELGFVKTVSSKMSRNIASVSRSNVLNESIDLSEKCYKALESVKSKFSITFANPNELCQQFNIGVEIVPFYRSASDVEAGCYSNSRYYSTRRNLSASPNRWWEKECSLNTKVSLDGTNRTHNSRVCFAAHYQKTAKEISELCFTSMAADLLGVSPGVASEILESNTLSEFLDENSYLTAANKEKIRSLISNW